MQQDNIKRDMYWIRTVLVYEWVELRVVGPVGFLDGGKGR
jgi:hypothetical protein